MAQTKRTEGEAKRPKISSSHTVPRAPKAEKPSAKASATRARKDAAAVDEGPGKVRSAAGAKPAGTKPAAKRTSVGPLASKPIPKTTRKSELQTAATTGKKAAQSGGLPTPEREIKRKAAGRPAQGEAAIAEARERSQQIAAAGLEKKASDVTIIDVCGKVDYADFLVLMTGTSDRHVASIVQSVEDEQQKRGTRALSVEGLPIANWVLVDFADVVVHVFQEDARGMYDIDGLWMDANRIPVLAYKGE